MVMMEAFLKDEGITGDSVKLCNDFYESLHKNKDKKEESDFDESRADDEEDYSDFETDRSNKSQDSHISKETYYSLADKTSNGVKAHNRS